MYYTKEQANEAVTLFFEGAGCASRGDVENCRIRTAFKTEAGEAIYLELCGFEKDGQNVGYVLDCRDAETGEDNREIEKARYPYSKQGIVDFINTTFGCNFDSIFITDRFCLYTPLKPGGGYFMQEDYSFNIEQSQARRAAYNRMDAYMRDIHDSQYSVISIDKISENSVTVRCYSSNEKMKKAGLDPTKRFTKIYVEGIGQYEPGDLVTQEVVDEYMNALPPACMRSDCSQLGEPYSHREDPESGKFRATYLTFAKVAPGLWEYRGHCFRGENTERGTDPIYA